MPTDETRPILESQLTVPRASRPGDPAAAILESGQVLAGRFRIVRFIAQGGMGEVWEAEDLELEGERVAVKTIRPRIAADEWALTRFRREIQLGKKVTHPNVCRVYDLFRHHPTLPLRGLPSGASEAAEAPGAEITFLTMQLLPGETLAARIAREGALAPEAALPLIRQMAEALGAAHDAGVIHGDFKSNNVILTGGTGGAPAGAADSRDLRAVVTDFGLARGAEPAPGGAASVPVEASTAGTPAYMAPEQIRGDPSSRESDLYSFGVVLYEMLSGRLPFAGRDPLAAARPGKAVESAPPLRDHAPGIDPRWERAVLRCLDPDPARRFPDARDVVRALVEDPEADRRRRGLRLGAVAASLALAAALGVVAARRLAPPAPEPARSVLGPALAVTPRRNLAVLGFKNLSGRTEAAWLSVALSEMLATDLAAGGKLRIIPAETVSRMKVELELAELDTLAPDTLQKIRSNIGSDFVVLGSYVALGREAGGRIRLDLRLQDARNGETVAAVSRNGTEADLFELVGGAGSNLRRHLGAGEVTATQSGEVQSSFPASPDAARLTAEGLARLRLFDAVAARDLLTRAVAADPKHPLAHAALSTAWTDLGYEERARQEARRAFELASGLPREQRLAVEARFRETAGEQEKAIEIYRTLFGFFPDNLEYGLLLAGAETVGGKGEAALTTLKALRRLPEPFGNDPRLDLAEADAYESRSDFTRQQAAAARCAERGGALGARLLVARARNAECGALRNLGSFDPAAKACRQAEELFLASGDRAGAARAVNNLGILAWQHGDLVAARGSYDRALATFREIGDQRGTARALNNIAIVLFQQGDLKAAKPIYAKVIAVYRETGNRRGLASTLSNLGVVQELEGDLGAAQATHEEALALRREVGDRQGEAVTLNNLAEVLVQRGDRAAARRSYAAALALFRDVGQKSGAADSLINLGEVDLQGGDLAPAERAYREALAIKRELDDGAGTATALAGLAELELVRGDGAAAGKALEEALALRTEAKDAAGASEVQSTQARRALGAGDPAAALAAAHAALDSARKAEDPPLEARARLTLAEVQLARGEKREAGREVARARALAAGKPDRRLRTALALTGARADLAAGRTGAARSALTALLAEAEKGGLLPLALETRLALAEVDLATGKGAAGRAALEAVEAEARSKGLESLAASARRRLASL